MSFAGSSASLPLPDLIQATAYAGRTCRVSVRGGGGAGELGFERGELVAACFQGDRGDAAVLAMLALDDVDYEMELTAPPDRDVAGSWQGLLLESARLRDEETRRARRNASNPAMVLPIPAPAVTGPVQARAPSVAGADERAERKRKWLVAVAAAGVTATLIVAAVAVMKMSGSETATRAASATAAAPAPAAAAPSDIGVGDATPVARTIVVKGSDTIGGAHGVGPLLAKAFEAEQPGMRVTWEGLGSATAFVGLLDGSADVGAASRSVNATELADAERLGVRLTPFVLGYDGVAVIVHPDAPITAITLPELARVFTGEVVTWRQLAGPGAPDQPIRLIARPAYSGTHAFFRDKVLGGKELAKRAQLIESTDDIVAAVAADRTTISFIGMGRVTPAVRALAVARARGAAPVLPERDAIRAGAYPIFRPLLLYVRGLPSPAVADLLRFCVGPTGQSLLADHGLVPGDTPPESIVAGDDERGSPAPMVALRIPFASGQTALDRDARIALGALAVELRVAPRPLTLSGHADAERGAGSNTDVARRRVEAVAAFLRTHGVDSRLIRVESAGDAAPVATNTTRAGRDQNRRVDIIVGSLDGSTP